jgi:hypothetical protein
MTVRKAAVAGSWYPGSADALSAAVDRYLAGAAEDAPRAPEHLVALVAPHAGLIYSGPVAAYAYLLVRQQPIDVVVLVGPSHFVGFEGVAAFRGAGFDTPFGVAPIDLDCTESLMQASAIVRDYPAAHAREHSLEMQLPFILRVAPRVKIVALVVGWQKADTARELGDALGSVFQGRRALLVASTDLSHYQNATVAAKLDSQVIHQVQRFDADGLMSLLETFPQHACGGGPTVSVMRAAKRLGARDACVLKYGDSGDVSGDKDAVVGYLAAAFGSFMPQGI